MGQELFLLTHEIKQSSWNKWPHGIIFALEPTGMASWQMGQVS